MAAQPIAARHEYRIRVTWTGNEGSGTSSHVGYSRAHRITAAGKPAIEGSSDPSFHGDPARWNPEELLLASLSACHKLWYLSLCAAHRVTVLAYQDDAEAVMVEGTDGAGQFTSVLLRPKVIITGNSDPAAARALHNKAHEQCFIARSVNFPVKHQADIQAATQV